MILLLLDTHFVLLSTLLYAARALLKCFVIYVKYFIVTVPYLIIVLIIYKEMKYGKILIKYNVYLKSYISGL